MDTTTAASGSDPEKGRGGRAQLPAVLLAEDVAAVLNLASASAARRLMNRGEVGQVARIGRRLVVRREEFLRAIEQAEIDPLVRRDDEPWVRNLKRGPERPS